MRGSVWNSWEEELYWPKRKIRLAQAKENRRDLRIELQRGGQGVLRITGITEKV